MPSTACTVVVTGASGFLGRSVAGQLTALGFNVVRATRAVTGGMATLPDYANAPAGGVLVHLAEEADRGKANDAGDRHVELSSRLLTTLASAGYEHIVYASSGTVYGDDHDAPVDTGMPARATDAYSRSKLLNEATVLAAGGAVARFSNIVGPGMSRNTVLADIVAQIPGNGPLRVRDITPVRDFLNVEDAAAACARIVERRFRGVLNVGSGTATSIKQLAELALEVGGESGREIVATAATSARSYNVLDIHLTTRVLAWAPQHDLAHSIKQLLSSSAHA